MSPAPRHAKLTAHPARYLPADFLRLLMREPSRVVAHDEGLPVIDQIAPMPPADIRSTVPAVFEAIHPKRQRAQLYGAFALWAIANRPDGAVLLDSRSSDVLALLQHDEIP